MQKVITFLMFDGKAEEAMNFYTSLIKNSEITSISRYGANEAGIEGTVQHATFSINGQTLSKNFNLFLDGFSVPAQRVPAASAPVQLEPIFRPPQGVLSSSRCPLACCSSLPPSQAVLSGWRSAPLCSVFFTRSAP